MVADDAGAVRVVDESADGPLVLVVDHASNRLPRRYGTLGLSALDLERHIAWDPGALPLARHLGERFKSPVVHGTVSRLVIDPNRAPGETGSILSLSETTAIPRNEGLDEPERRRRVDEVYTPFHTALEQVLEARRIRGVATALVAVHSFNPVYRGVERPWHAGVIYDQDARLGRALIEGLRGMPGLVVGDNEPYRPEDGVYHTVGRHGEGNGLACAMIEVRNDLIQTQADQETWADRLATALDGCLEAVFESRRATRP